MMEGIPDIFGPMLFLLAITIPLGLWKLIDIIVWLVQHIHITLK